tara:strand:- start:15619 stop:15813 length:195 start_codon:yes stop_codon:yes gene_type:complete
MDKSNLDNILSLAPDIKSRKKVSLLIENKNVPDPYYDEDKGFENCFRLIEKACQKISKRILTEN